MVELKSGVEIRKKNGLFYRIDGNGKLIQYKPWLVDFLSFVYDFSMRNSVFPKKFGADMQLHYEILRQALENVQDQKVLELGTGSGSVVHFLGHENQYTGTDVSQSLMKQAKTKLDEAGFIEPEFYVTGADNIPFGNDVFDVCLCILTLNFIADARASFTEIQRVLKPAGLMLCSVPVPERNSRGSTINGTLYSENELAALCKECGFRFESIPCENGALLYFKALTS